jgi:tRNA pseudouridine55 synthase
MGASKVTRNSSPSGLLILNKKPGVTSFEALGAVKRSLGTGKVGHTGTLDKFAQGLLLVLAGRALKLSSWFTHCDKRYRGTIRFGAETDTLDPEGVITGEAAVPSREDVEQALLLFRGEIMQAPPAYSAIHVNGKRASDIVRSGGLPEMKKRPVHIYELELCSWEPPFAEIYVHCSSGAYIRSLARDIAMAAGSRAHLCGLIRTQVAGFTLDMAQEILCPVDASVIDTLGLPRLDVAPEDAEKIMYGKPLAPILDANPLLVQPPAVAVFSGGAFIAIVEKNGGKWKYGCVY